MGGGGGQCSHGCEKLLKKKLRKPRGHDKIRTIERCVESENDFTVKRIDELDISL